MIISALSPEKDHATQLRSFCQLLQIHPKYATGPNSVKLVLVGGSRNAADAARVDDLRELARQLGIEVRRTFLTQQAQPYLPQDHVEFVINASYPVVLDWLRRSSIGFSTMVDEHFGINIVEFMACGFQILPV